MLGIWTGAKDVDSGQFVNTRTHTQTAFVSRPLQLLDVSSVRGVEVIFIHVMCDAMDPMEAGAGEKFLDMERAFRLKSAWFPGFKDVYRDPKKHISISILWGYPYLYNGLHCKGVYIGISLS